MNIYKAFLEVKNRSMERPSDSNRKTLQTFLKFGFELGLCQRKLDVDELCPPLVLGSYKV